MTTIRAPLALSLIGLLAFSGCTGSNRRSGPPSENVVRFPLDEKITTLDPHLANDVYSTMASNLVYDSLYEFHYLKRPLELVPSLAESLPVWSKDHKRLTIKLKKGIFFQDDACFPDGKGREFNADDVVYMIERISTKKLASPGYGNFEDRIVGVNDFHEGKATSISGVKAVDRYTVSIQLTRPLPRFAYVFADVREGIVAKECVEKLGDEFRRHPVGTGPYHYIESDLASKMVAVRNPKYHQMTYPTSGGPGDKEKGLLEDAGKPLPLPDKIVLEVMIEKQPQWLRFLAGDFELQRIPKDNIPAALPDGKLSPDLTKLGIKHLQFPRSDVTLHIFNMEDPVWGKNKDLRHAFQLALDIPEIIRLQYSGQAIQAQSLIDPSQYGYEKDFVSKWSKRDLAKSRELLAKAGYPGGKGLPPIYMPTNDGTTARHLDELLERQLKEVGITLKLEPMTWPEFDAHIRQKNFTVIGMGEASSEPDADDATGLLISKNESPGPNAANYKNPEVDKLANDIETMENGSARWPRSIA